MAERRVLVRFTDGIPPVERRWIARLIRRVATLWHTEGFEYQVSARNMGDTLGMCTLKVLSMATIVEIVLNPKRFPDRRAMRVDLIHELLHVFDEEVRHSFVDLAAHIPDDKRRARALRRADRRYEAWHDRQARVWADVLT